jgi:hypothetical protein
MATVITDEQRVEVRKNPRFEDMTKTSAANYAIFIHGNDGTTPPGGMSPQNWALQRFFIAEQLLQNPNGMDTEQWKYQYSIFMKGLAIWDTDVEKTIDFMIANNIFEQLASQTFALKAENVKF